MRIISFRSIMALVLAGVLGIVSFAGAQKPGRADVALEAAAKKEMVDGDLKGAIDSYQKIVAQYGATDRASVATALVRMGQCYERLGSAEARKAYERAVREFSDQKDAAATAQARLVALGTGRSGMTLRLVWGGPKVNRVSTDGTVSPDGRYLSYTDWDTGDLALHDLTANTDRRLTNEGSLTQSAQFAEESVISRDGKQVAYSWYSSQSGRYQIRIAALPASGFLQPRRLFDREDVGWIGPYDWSPDGRWLAVELYTNKDLPRAHQIGLLSTQDGSLRVLTAGGATRMFFSPDGKFLGVDLAAGSDGDRHVFTLAVDGTGRNTVIENAGQNLMMGWSPDGSRLLFASDRRESMDLWGIPISNGKPQGAAELIRPGIAPWALGVTASGVLYLGAGISNRDINVASVDFNTGKLLSAPTRPVQTLIGQNDQPDWSPDGKSLVYVSGRKRSGDAGFLAVRSLETGRVRRLWPNLKMFNYPRWDPDGRSFVCQGTDFSNQQGIYRIDAQTGDVVPIIAGPAKNLMRHMPQWSPDGRRIYYYGRDAEGVTIVVERDLASGAERELLRRERQAPNFFPNVSPDGRYVAAISADTDSTALLLVTAEGGAGSELLHAKAPQRLAGIFGWTADSRGVIVLKQDVQGPGELWIVSAAGGQPRKLDIDTRGIAGYIRVHPDGRQIAYFAGDGRQEVWVLENFLAAK